MSGVLRDRDCHGALIITREWGSGVMERELGPLLTSTDESRQRIGRVSIEVVARPVVSPRRSRVCVTGSVLNVPEADASIQAQGHKRVSQVVRMQACCLCWDCCLRKSPERSPHRCLIESSTC